MQRREVLDRGWLQLEEVMGGDAAVVRGARICYGSVAQSPDADVRLIRRLMAAHPTHNTVFEHAVFRFGCKCPLFVARQWMRHRMGTFNERSMRYCIAEREYYVPSRDAYAEGLRPKRSEPLAERSDGISAEEAEMAVYVGHMEASFDVYGWLLEQGWRPERARAVLGTAVYTEFVWTVNAWSLMNWLHKRLDAHSQWEHRQYALAGLELFSEAMPITARAFREEVLHQ